MFVERLLNRNWFIYRSNIEKESMVFQKILNYFTNWMVEKDAGVSIDGASAGVRDSYFISIKTSYHNLLTLMKEYMGYAM